MEHIPSRIVTVFLTLLVLSAPLRADLRSKVHALAEDIAKEYHQKADQVLFRQRLAILDLKDTSPNLRRYETGKSVSALLASRLSQSLLFTLVERENLKRLVSELELGQSGLVDESTAPQAGRLLAADLILDGSVSEIGDQVQVHVRLLRVETAEVLVTRTTTLPRDQILQEAKAQHFEAFQSRHGLSLSVAGLTIFPDRKYRTLVAGFGTYASYKLTRNLETGVGYGLISANELVREQYWIQQNEIWRNYNYKAQFGSLFVSGFVSPWRWLNLGLRLEGAFLDPRLNQDITDFPVRIPTGPTNTLETKRILVDGWFNAFPSLMGAAFASADILLSKRVSFNIRGGYAYTTEFLPTVFESAGRRQWDNSGGDPKRMDEPDADLNGTFSEYGGYNFSRFADGSRVKFDISGVTLAFGLSIHF